MKSKLPDRLVPAEKMVADHLPGHTPRTLRRWAKDGFIPCYRINAKVVLFNPDEVMAAIAKRREHATAELVGGGAR